MNHKLMIPLKCISVALAVLLALFMVFDVLEVSASEDATMLLYNGVEYPSFYPVFDEYGTSYPYCTIAKHLNDSSVYLILSKTMLFYYSDGGGLYKIGVDVLIFQEVDSSWSYLRSETWNGIKSYYNDIIWCNFDLYDSNDELYLGASYPQSVVPPSTSAEMPVFTVNVPLVPWYEYNVGDTPDPISVTATVSDGGTVSYTWFKSDWTTDEDISSVEYSTGNTLTIDTSTVGEYHYVCRATNTNGSYVNSCYSNTLVVKIVESGAADLPEPTPTYPSADDIGFAVGDSIQDIYDQADKDASDSGSSFVDDITSVVPDYSEGFINSLGGLVSALSYDGTECVLTTPPLVFPEIPGLIPEYTLLESQSLDFESYFQLFPDMLVTVVRAFFTVALIIFCFKELYDTIAYFFTLKEGKVTPIE